MNRRHFLAASAAVTALAAAPDEEKEIVFPVIDTHQYLWDLGKNHLMRDYLTATTDLGQVGGLPAQVVWAC